MVNSAAGKSRPSSERGLEKWYRFCDSIVIGETYSSLATLTSLLDPFGPGRMIRLNRKLIKAYFKADSVEGRRRSARDTYIRRYERVKRVTPKERLLEFDLKGGWGSLCGLLEKDVPGEPFPHVNEMEELRRTVRDYQQEGVGANLRALLPWGAAVVAVGVAIYL